MEENSLAVFQDFPTKKPHVSYSEVRTWKECAWRHKLVYVDCVGTNQPSQHLSYGTLVHACVESYLKTRSLDGLVEKVEADTREEWKRFGFDSSDFIQAQIARAKTQGWNYKHNDCEDWINWAKNSILSVPLFLDKNFPGWELVSAEEPLYESVDDKEIKFKGFIDAIIKVPVGQDKFKYWILDWKTASPGGWSLEKKRDFLVHAQVALYKYFWSKKNNVDLKDIKTGFVLLKKGLPLGKSCQLIEVSTGPSSIEKSSKLVGNMIAVVSKKLFLKNKNSCKFCEFQGTKYCT